MKQRTATAPVRLTLRFYPGQDDDLLRWLEALDTERHGGKNQVVKDTLRMAVSATPSERPSPASITDRPAELTAVLVEVRRVVEAAIVSALGRFAYVQQMGGAVTGTMTTVPTDDDEEVDGLLEALEQALVLGEEDL